MIKDNAIYLLILFVMVCLPVVAFYIKSTDKGDGKRKKIAGYLVFGGLWPLIEKYKKQDVSYREKILIIAGLIFMVVAIVYTFIETNGTFVWR